MSTISVWAASLRQRLARHLSQLRHGFESLGERLRQSVAHTVGRTVADAVTEAVDAALGMPPDHADHYPPARPRSLSDCSTDWWHQPGESPWSRQEDYDRYDRPYAEDRNPYPDNSDEEPAETPPPRKGRLGRALAAGLHAAAWWLQRHHGRLSVLIAAGVGLVAGLLALVGFSTVGTAGLFVSALGLLALDGLMRSASTVLGRAASP